MLSYVEVLSMNWLGFNPTPHPPNQMTKLSNDLMINHEPPRIGYGSEILEEGNVVTVEPGLYYERLGGIRIEDVVVVKKKGCINLTRYPKRFRV